MPYKTKNPGKPETPNVIHIPADMFPPGMAETLKAGEVIEFKIAQPLDGDREVGIAYNYGDDDQGGEQQPDQAQDMPEGGEGGEQWEDEARRVLNPQDKESEAM